MKEQQETNYCRHYNGRGFADGTYCRAGVPDSMFGAAAGAGLRRPCVDPNPFARGFLRQVGLIGLLGSVVDNATQNIYKNLLTLFDYALQ